MSKRGADDGGAHVSGALFDVYPEGKVEQQAIELGVRGWLGPAGLLGY